MKIEYFIKSRRWNSGAFETLQDCKKALFKKMQELKQNKNNWGLSLFIQQSINCEGDLYIETICSYSINLFSGAIEIFEILENNINTYIYNRNLDEYKKRLAR